jgi:hypothetical protein
MKLNDLKTRLLNLPEHIAHANLCLALSWHLTIVMALNRM